MEGIKNIIFDLGGVIINLNMGLTEKAFEGLLGEKAALLKNQEALETIFYPFEVGAITEQEFRDRIRSHTNTSVTDHQVDEAWNAMLLDIPKERLNLLLSLKNRYRIFLFSNTNAIHYTAFNKYLKETHNYEDLSPFFEKDHYSHILGQRKPHPEAFTSLIELHGLNSKETVFLDDTQQHLGGADKAGLNTIHVTADDHILKIFKNS